MTLGVLKLQPIDFLLGMRIAELAQYKLKNKTRVLSFYIILLLSKGISVQDAIALRLRFKKNRSGYFSRQTLG
jgi:hypothetical protein